MQLDLFQKYLIGINIFAFCVFTIDFVIYLQDGKGIKLWWICDLVTIIGGSLGTLIAFLLWDRRVGKKNITWRVFTVCMLIIHVVIYFSYYSILNGEIEWEGINHLILGVETFGKTHMWFWYYLLVINLITFVVFAVDKVRAIRHHWRIRELVLLAFSLIGGSIGGFIAMYTLRHKIKSPQFYFGLPMIMLAQIVMLIYWVARSI